ncbi:MAG: dockerin type I repeat-containing protein, partial [Oscillospiraceae bacterium]|nr:dockerin type I repeat-containing protein [Oscillospiraceae bacterium]
IYDNNGEEKQSVLGNFIFSYATNTTEIADNSKRYYPAEDSLTGETIWTGATLMWKGDAGTDENLYDRTTWAAVYPKSEQKIIDGKRQVVSNVVYEIALPWAVVGEGVAPQKGESTELGFSMTRLNATNKDSNGNFNSYLSWGSGVTGFETKHMPQVCGGSNSLVLTDESYSDAVNCEHTFAAPTCINPETCTQCGYERGFVSGHKYTFSNESLPTGKNDGSISALCTICGDSFTKTIDSKEASVKFDFLETDTTLHDQGWVSENGFTIQWETLDEEGNRYTDETDPDGTKREKLWVDSGELNADGTPKMIAKNSFDNTYFPGVAVADLRYSGQTGTYFDSNSYETSYTEAMDVYFTELNPHDPADDAAYNTYFGQWFGGENGVSYYGGLFEVDGQFFFTILPSAYQKVATVEEFKAHALSFVPATAEQIALNTWHEYVFMYDNNVETAMVIWDGELVASASDYHFATSRSDIQVIFLNHNTSCFVKNVEIGSTGLAAARSGWQGDVVVPSTFTATINGVAAEYAVGDTIELAAETVYSSMGNTYRFVGWTGDTDVLADASETAYNTSFDMPANNVTIEAEYIMIGDVDLNGKVNAADSLTLKRVAAGIDTIADAELEIYYNINGDKNNDGSSRINAGDSNLVSRIIASVWIPTASDFATVYGN